MNALALAALIALFSGGVSIPPNATYSRAPSVQELRSAIIQVAAQEFPVIVAWPNAAMAGATKTGGFVVGSAATTLTRASFNVTSASGGGAAANTVITATDGTNTCTFSLPCTTSNATGAFSVAGVNGSGTGCAFAASAALTASVTTAGCATTQPTVSTLTILGVLP